MIRLPRPPRSHRTHLWAYGVFALILSALFVASAAVRRLNFDEALALRSGWLLVADIPSEPAFYMPWTLALGVLGHVVDDPGAVFTIARVVTSLAMLAAIAWAAWRHDPRWEIVFLTVAVALGHYTFTTHALEFRYDSAIQLGLVIAYAAMMRGGFKSQIWVGLAAAWLFFHHLKGVYYAGVVIALAHLSLIALGGQIKEGLKGLYTGIAAGAGLWLLLSAIIGHLDDLALMYTTFFDLATSSERGDRLRTLKDGITSDDIWYALALILVAYQLGLSIARRDKEENRKVALALALVGATVLFLMLHPRPWPYLLAMPAPLVAIVMAQSLKEIIGRIPVRFAIYAAMIGAGIHLAMGYNIQAMSYVKAFKHDNSHQVAALRALKGMVEPGDKILDPSGLAYFVEPVHAQWYIDRLFMDAAVAGDWMRGIEYRVPRDCRWVLYTYRLRLLPPRVRERVTPYYYPLGGGIGINRDDPNVERYLLTPDLPRRRLRSHW